MKTKEKIRYFLEKQEITIYKFEQITGLSHGILKSGKDFQADKLKQIRDALPYLNMNWLVYDEGEMLLKGVSEVSEPRENYKKKCSEVENLENELALTKALVVSKDEIIDLLKLQMEGSNSKTG